MNILDEFRQDELRVLDRLVDGELSADERRLLLAGLDDEPGAWRRCALAFLEAQSWRGQIARLLAEPEARPTLTDRPAQTFSKRATVWGACLAIAASLLVAFALGTKYPGAGEPLQANHSPAPAGETEMELVQNESVRDENRDEVAENDRQWAEPASAGQDPQTITLAVADGDESEQEIQLPVSNASENDGSWDTVASAIPAELLRNLEQAGLRVRRQQRFMPIELSDGRRLVVPIEEIEIHDPQLVQY
jgi:hypothetical protein